MSRGSSQPSSATAADQTGRLTTALSRSRKFPEFRMTAGAIATTVVMLIVTFALALMIGSKPMLPALVAGAFLFAVLLFRNPSWLVHALLIVLFTTRTEELPLGIRVFGYLIYFYEFLLFASLLYTMWLLRASPFAAKRLRNSVAVWAAVSFGITIAIGVSLGILRGYPLYDIQYDARPVINMMIAASVAAIIVAVNDWQRYMKTIIAILIFSAAVTVFASANGMSLAGRTESAELRAVEGYAIGGGSEAIRYLTDTTQLALAVLIGCVALLVLGRLTAKQAAPMLIPALMISLLSFSRNTILALAGTIVFALLIALLDGQLLRLVPRLVSITLVAGVAVFGLFTLGRALGAGDWIDTQVSGYGNRVIAGLTQSYEKEDRSTLYRLEENRYITITGAHHPIFGNGYGKRYKPPVGEYGTFHASLGTLYAHNSYGWLYVKVGVAGVATFLTLIGASVLPALFRHRSSLLLAATATLVGVSVILIVVPLPNGHGDSALLGLVIGACIGAGALRAPRASAQRHESQLPSLAISSNGQTGRGSRHAASDYEGDPAV